MKTDIHLLFNGTCDKAFSFYETVFNTKCRFTMKFGDAPAGAPVPAGFDDLIMHTSLVIGPNVLMGCDTPPGMGEPMGGFQISIGSEDEAEVKRLFAALSEGGKVDMPLTPTFWSPLFGMCKDKFGVGWMVSIPGPQQPPA